MFGITCMPHKLTKFLFFVRKPIFIKLKMGQLSEESRMAMEKSVMGGLEMIEPDKRPNPQELFQFVIDDFINSSQISEWDGYRFPPGFRTNTAQYAYDKFEPKEGDVMVASYGKTGERSSLLRYNDVSTYRGTKIYLTNISNTKHRWKTLLHKNKREVFAFLESQNKLST